MRVRSQELSQSSAFGSLKDDLLCILQSAENSMPCVSMEKGLRQEILVLLQKVWAQKVHCFEEAKAVKNQTLIL